MAWKSVSENTASIWRIWSSSMMSQKLSPRKLALRVVDDVDDVGRSEVLQYRDDYGAEGDRGYVGDAPPGIVAPDQRYFVPLLYAGLFEQEVQLGDLLGHLVIRECFTLEIVGQRRHFTVLAKTRLVYFYQVFL